MGARTTSSTTHIQASSSPCPCVCLAESLSGPCSVAAARLLGLLHTAGGLRAELGYSLGLSPGTQYSAPQPTLPQPVSCMHPALCPAAALSSPHPTVSTPDTEGHRCTPQTAPSTSGTEQATVPTLDQATVLVRPHPPRPLTA